MDLSFENPINTPLGWLPPRLSGQWRRDTGVHKDFEEELVFCSRATKEITCPDLSIVIVVIIGRVLRGLVKIFEWISFRK